MKRGMLKGLAAVWTALALLAVGLCGALAEDGDTGEGEYDEDEAVEFLLDALLREYPADGDTAALYCAVIEQFLPLFDDYLLAQGLLSL